MSDLLFVSASNPRWADPTMKRIDVDAVFQGVPEPSVPYTSYKDDECPVSRSVFARALSGDFGEIQDYIPPSNKAGEDALELLREQRNELLQETDYIEMPTKWASLTAEKQSEWTVYRNALRDLPSTVVDPVYTVRQTVDGANYRTEFVPSFSFPVKPE